MIVGAELEKLGQVMMACTDSGQLTPPVLLKCMGSTVLTGVRLSCACRGNVALQACNLSIEHFVSTLQGLRRG